MERFFVSARIQDPEAYRRDYLAIPPSAVSPFIDYPERIDDCIVVNPNPIVTFDTKEFSESIGSIGMPAITRNYVGKTAYVLRGDRMTERFLSCDQGEKRDAFVVAMGHGKEVDYQTEDAKGNPITMTRYKVIIDFIEGWEPNKERKVTVSFPNVEDVILTLHNHFYIKKVCFCD